MSATPPPPPAVIGSGKPHTVSIKPGTNVATSLKPRKLDDEVAEGLTARLKATLRKGEESSLGRRGAGEAPEPAPWSAQEGSAETATAPHPSGLSHAIQQRIAQLRQRNEAVGRELDSLPPAGRRTR